MPPLWLSSPPQFAGGKATRTCRPQTHHCLVVWTGPPEKTSACRLRRRFQVEPGGGQTRPRGPSPENTPSNRAPVGAQAAEQLLDQQTSLTPCSARGSVGSAAPAHGTTSPGLCPPACSPHLAAACCCDSQSGTCSSIPGGLASAHGWVWNTGRHISVFASTAATQSGHGICLGFGVPGDEDAYPGSCPGP